MKHLLAIVVCLSAAPSLAQTASPCPTFTAGWGKQYQPPGITAVLYDETSLIMYVIWNYTEATAYDQVPLSTMQAFSQSADPTQTYNLILANSHASLLLQEKNNCPILAENGTFISTNGLSP